MATQSLPPQLDPPGAGLPLGQRLLVRYFVGPFVSKRAVPKEVRSKYEHITKKMIASIEGVPLSQLKTRVLVDPISGLEDSSRFWSAEQVFEHLLIVSRAVEGVILTLASGKTVEQKVSTAAVKPKGVEGAVEDFKIFAPGLLERIDLKLKEEGLDLESPVTHFHPWFGQMNARQWYWLLSTHQSIHAGQLKAILRKGGVK